MSTDTVSSLKSLRAKRTRLCHSLDRTVKYLDTRERDKNSNLAELNKRKDILEPMLNQYENIQEQIEELADIECEDSEREEFERKYFHSVGLIDKLISDHSPPSIEIKQNDSLHSSESREPSMRLPRISIPEFSGSYEEWTNFHDTFSSLVDANPDIPNVQKFHYLKSALKGTATETLRSLSISNENYTIAWSMLKKRYDNKRLIVEEHIRAIFQLPSMQKDNPIPLRSILDGIIRHTSALESLEVPVKHWDSLLIYLIKTKMDFVTNKDWEAHLPDITSLPTLETLINFLNKKCQTLESISRASFQTSSATQRRVSHMATVTNCKICSKNHMIFQCDVFLKMTPDQRIKAKQLCLKPNHTTQRCLSKSCKICHKKHNTLLHIPTTDLPKPPVSSRKH